MAEFQAPAIEQEAVSVAAPPFDDEAGFGISLEEPPFDPPDPDDDIFTSARSAAPAADGELLLVRLHDSADDGPKAAPQPALAAPPAPAITIHASWDRTESADLLARFASDARLARTDITIGRGGLEGASARLCDAPAPDLLILDTTLSAPDILSGLKRLAPVMRQGAKIIVLGAVNDIALLRELSAHGVIYIMAPFAADELAAIVCGLFAQTDKSRVIAVVGSRGGVGASTIAHNLAWSIAERQDAATVLADLDLAFGAAATHADQRAVHSLADALLARDPVDDAEIGALLVRQHARLHLLAAPAALQRDGDIDAQALDALIKRVRRRSSFVVLDVPHRWTPWAKQALLAADDVVIVATPDLASLRNAKNLFEQLAHGRSRNAAPVLALSMVGVPKRPEISSHDFSESLGIEPIATFAFDPTLFGLAALHTKMLGEIAPRSVSALAIDALASALTGRNAVRKKAVCKPKSAPVVAETPTKAAPSARRKRPPTQQRDAPQRPARGRPGALRAIAALMALLYVGVTYIGAEPVQTPSPPANDAALRDGPATPTLKTTAPI